MTEKRVWESKLTAIDHSTGELQDFIAPHYFEGVNRQEAHNALHSSGIVYLQLTGNSFSSIEKASDIKKFYDTMSEPYYLTKGMTYDEFHDWLDLGDEEDVISALEAFKEDGRVGSYVEMIEGYLKHKYGWEKDND